MIETLAEQFLIFLFGYKMIVISSVNKKKKLMVNWLAKWLNGLTHVVMEIVGNVRKQTPKEHKTMRLTLDLSITIT